MCNTHAKKHEYLALRRFAYATKLLLILFAHVCAYTWLMRLIGTFPYTVLNVSQLQLFPIDQIP